MHRNYTRRTLAGACTAFVTTVAATLSIHVAAADPAVDAALKAKAEQALTRGAAFLVDNQEDNGAWGELPHPATAALAAMALHDVPAPTEASRAATERAMAFVVAYAQEDGSIYPAGAGKNASANFPNYTTCIALMAMSTMDKEEYLPLMQKARAYIKAAQFQDPSTPDYGGLGYGHSGRADLSNAGWASEALYYTAYLDDENHGGAPEASAENAKMWERFASFVTSCQNLPETNEGDQVSTDARDLGGFAYMPTASKAGTRPDETDGKPNLVSSGSMTYAGLKSMIYARLEPKDRRVQGAVDFACRHFTVDENPGMDQQAYYFYLYAMTRALDVYGQETLTLADGSKVQWREAMITKLLSLQKEDGSWWNAKDARFMESMPELTTPYIMLALEVAIGNNGLVHE